MQIADFGLRIADLRVALFLGEESLRRAMPRSSLIVLRAVQSAIRNPHSAIPQIPHLD